MVFFLQKPQKGRTVKPRNNGFEGTKHSYPLLPKSVIANIEIKRYECQGTRAKSVIVRFSTTLGSVIAGFHCTIHNIIGCSVATEGQNMGQK